MQKYLKEVEDRVKRKRLTVPQQRSAFRQKYSFSHLPFEEQMEIWDYVWKKTDDHSTQTQAFFFCESFMKNESHLLLSWDTIVNWQDQVNDWPLCDCLSKIYTKILEVAPKKVFPVLKKWNKDTDLWKRRQSLVSMLYYTGTKKVHLTYAEITPLIERLLDDPEYYVQKGVGWTLRELHTTYPDQGYEYISKNIHRVSGIAFAAASEKLSPAKKQKLKDKRR